MGTISIRECVCGLPSCVLIVELTTRTCCSILLLYSTTVVAVSWPTTACNAGWQVMHAADPDLPCALTCRDR